MNHLLTGVSTLVWLTHGWLLKRPYAPFILTEYKWDINTRLPLQNEGMLKARPLLCVMNKRFVQEKRKGKSAVGFKGEGVKGCFLLFFFYKFKFPSFNEPSSVLNEWTVKTESRRGKSLTYYV
jgi:hypothetical protein